MTQPRAALLALGLLGMLSLGGCFWSIGGGTDRTVVEHTAGQQLTDLKRALDAGAISPEEYDKLKTAYLNK